MSIPPAADIDLTNITANVGKALEPLLKLDQGRGVRRKNRRDREMPLMASINEIKNVTEKCLFAEGMGIAIGLLRSDKAQFDFP
jgi:hypothetical protein